VVYSLDSRSVVDSGTFQLAGGLTVDDFVDLPAYQVADAPALVYIPPLNRYWFTQVSKWYDATVGGHLVKFFECDPTTAPWTMRMLTFTGVVPNPYYVQNRKMMFSAPAQAVILLDQGDQPMYVYRF
jgi:hypothetical protein